MTTKYYKKFIREATEAVNRAIPEDSPFNKELKRILIRNRLSSIRETMRGKRNCVVWKYNKRSYKRLLELRMGKAQIFYSNKFLDNQRRKEKENGTIQ